MKCLDNCTGKRAKHTQKKIKKKKSSLFSKLKHSLKNSFNDAQNTPSLITMEIPTQRLKQLFTPLGLTQGTAVSAITAEQHVKNFISISSADILPGYRGVS